MVVTPSELYSHIGEVFHSHPISFDEAFFPQPGIIIIEVTGLR